MNESPIDVAKEKGPGLVDQSNDPLNTQCDFITVSEFPTVTFTLGRSSGITGKTHSIVDGKVETTRTHVPGSGALEHVSCPLDQLPQFFSDPKAFMVLGVIKESRVGDKARLITKDQEAEGTPGIARTKDNFGFPTKGPCLLLVDVDFQTQNAHPPLNPMEPKFALAPVHAALRRLERDGVKHEGLKDVACLGRPSASAGLILPDGGESKGSKNWHFFYALVGKTPGAVLDYLHKELVIRGMGCVYVSANGVPEVRTYIDATVGSPERVSFEAAPVLKDGITREAKDKFAPGGVLDLTGFDLAVDEVTYATVCQKLLAEDGVKKLIKARLAQYRKDKAAELEAAGLTPEQARENARTYSEGGKNIDLYPASGEIFYFDDGSEVTITELLANPGAYDGKSMRDPTDLKDRATKAKFYWNQRTDLSPEQFVINLIMSSNKIFLHAEDVEDTRRRGHEANPTDDATQIELARLAALNPVDYSRERPEAYKRMGLSRMADLDAAVEAERTRLVADDADDSDGRRPATLGNVMKALKNPKVSGIEIALDEFTATQVWTPAGKQEWREWTDAKSVEMRMHLAVSGMKEVSKDIMRDALVQAADSNRIDTAQIWAAQLPAWDGTPRCVSFFADLFGARNTAYTRAVGLYTWSALAGRLLTPGAKADMVPTLIGKQGARKSSGVEAMAPTPETFVEVSLHDKEDDIRRKMVGSLIGEIGELAGLNKREIDWFKMFTVRRKEEWVPKWCERTTAYPRRLLFMATTNEDKFLRDATGERRWLPLEVGDVDVSGIIENRDQLWAEALVLYRQNGVMFQDAEELAKKVVGRHKEECPDADLISDWLDREHGNHGVGPSRGKPKDWPFIKSVEAASGIGIENKDIERHKHRISRAMRTLGYISVKRRFDPGRSAFHAWIRPE